MFNTFGIKYVFNKLFSDFKTIIVLALFPVASKAKTLEPGVHFPTPSSPLCPVFGILGSETISTHVTFCDVKPVLLGSTLSTGTRRRRHSQTFVYQVKKRLPQNMAELAQATLLQFVCDVANMQAAKNAQHICFRNAQLLLVSLQHRLRLTTMEEDKPNDSFIDLSLQRNKLRLSAYISLSTQQQCLS